MLSGYRPFGSPGKLRGIAGPVYILVALLVSTLPALALTVEQIVSAKGIKAWLVEEHSVPLIAMKFAFAGGAAQDPRGKEGLTTLVCDLLTEGAGNLSAADFKHQVSLLGARLTVSGGRDAIYGGLETPSERFGPSAELLRLALIEPRLYLEAIDRVRGQSLTNLALAASDATALALDRWYAEAFANRAYGRPVNGTPESLARLMRDDVEAQHARLFARDGLKVVIVGHIDRRAAAEALDAIFGGLPEKAQLTGTERVEPRSVPAPVVIDKDFPLASAIFGLPALRSDDPDFPALQVLNHIIGSGNFDARLMEEIRVKRGLAYSVKTSLIRDSMTSLLFGGFATKNENMGTALDVLKDVLSKTARDGPTLSQFDNAKLYLTGSFLLDFDTSAKVASSLLRLWIDGEGPEYLGTRNQKINAVTLGDIKRVAGEVLKVDRLIVTIVGRPKLGP
jgi:zinc protease